MGWDVAGSDGAGWDGMERDWMGWDGMGWDYWASRRGRRSAREAHRDWTCGIGTRQLGHFELHD